MAKKIVFGNFKGGTGKTTNSTLIAYHLSKLKKKTLLVDLDPQANATSVLLLTNQNQQKNMICFTDTLMNGINKGDIEGAIISINEYLDLLPSAPDFTAYPLFLEMEFPFDKKNNFDKIQEQRNYYLSSLIKNLESDYEFIIFDVPPTLSIYTDSAILASDYVIIVLQTQERSFVGANAFIEYLQGIYDRYDHNFDILGILPVLLKKNAIVDQSVLKNSRETFGEENLFKTLVVHLERLKRYDITGIIDPDINDSFDMHDTRIHTLYSEITQEMLERLHEIERKSADV